MTTRKAALAITLMLGAAMPALAQAQQPAAGAQQPAAAAQPTRQVNLSRQEQAAIQPLHAAAVAGDWATAGTLLPAAAAAARGPDAKYLVGQIRRLVGVNTQNQAMQVQGVDEMIASGGAPAGEMIGLYNLQLEAAAQARDQAKVDRALAELNRLTPNDPGITLRAIQLRAQAGDRPGALAQLQQAIQQRQSASQPVPAEWRRQVLTFAYQARSPETISLMRDFLAADPTPRNWHDAMVIYMDISAADSALKLDIYRLMHAANALLGEGEYFGYYDAANAVRLFGENKLAMEEGLSRNIITANAAIARERLATANTRVAGDRTSFADDRARIVAGADGQAIANLADIYFSYAQYAEAATVYRAALGKSGADANTVNLRMGAALALAGRRADAEAALRAVTAGPRAQLAQYWLLWLSSRPAS